ncbi:hypothetical protein BWI17_15795 [Betaproteobacteria bacterium GR16-43]|nr:hypothetical protein BWI17_15795 [Betaproteobacteria bacterium GR16-43]
MQSPTPRSSPADGEPLYDRFQAAFVRVMGGLVVVGGLIGIGLALAAEQPLRAVSSTPYLVVGSLVMLLMHLGHHRAAGLTLLYGSWLTAAAVMAFGAGIRAPGPAGVFLIIVMIAGWISSTRTIVALVIATIAWLGFMAHAESIGWGFLRLSPTPPFYTFLVISTLVLIGGVIGQFAWKSMRSRVERVDSLRRRFELLFRSGGTGNAIVVPETREIVDCNDAFCALIGRTREEIVGRSALELGYWVDLGERNRAFEIFKREGQLHDFEAVWVRPGGERRNVLLAWRSIDLDGEARTITQATDITRFKAVEEALRASEDKFATAFRLSADSIVIARMKDNVFVDVNEGFERMSGISRDEAVGRTRRELGMILDAEYRDSLIDGLAEGRPVVNVPIRARHRTSGRIMDCRLTAALVDIGGETHVLSTLRDVTAENLTYAALEASKRELDEANRRLQDQLVLHEHTERIAKVGHFVTDLETGLVRWSRSIFEIMDLPARGPMTIDEARRLADLQPEDRLVAARARLDNQPEIYQAISTSGARRWVRLAFTRPPEDSGQQYSGVMQDVTGEYEAKLALERLNADLERRVSERTAELRAAVQELDAFSYSVAHDLNAPLRAIHGFASLLRESLGERLDEAERRSLERIRASTERMAELIADLLKLSRVARAQIRREALDISAIAQRVANALQSEDPERKVDWRIEPGLTAEGDRGLIQAMLENLLGNAWKYTRHQTQPVIELRRGESVLGLQEFFVRDNGAGFDPAGASTLFRPFSRLHSENQFEGSGIGLATARRIVQRHGGEIRAESQAGGGATFTFSLPLV